MKMDSNDKGTAVLCCGIYRPFNAICSLGYNKAMREEGYYWVKYRGNWIVSECTFGIYWWIPGNEYQLNDSDFEEIDEKRLTHDS